VAVQFSSVTQSCLSFYDPIEKPHVRLPCPSSTPRACSNSCLSSQWYHSTISSSVVPFTCSISTWIWTFIKSLASSITSFSAFYHNFDFFFKLMFLNWPLKNWCFWTVVLEKTIGSPLDYMIKPATPKRTMPWIFIGRTDAEPEAPILWPPDAKNWLHRKDPDAGKDWR